MWKSASHRGEIPFCSSQGNATRNNAGTALSCEKLYRHALQGVFLHSQSAASARLDFIRIGRGTDSYASESQSVDLNHCLAKSLVDAIRRADSGLAHLLADLHRYGCRAHDTCSQRHLTRRLLCRKHRLVLLRHLHVVSRLLRLRLTLRPARI